MKKILSLSILTLSIIFLISCSASTNSEILYSEVNEFESTKELMEFLEKNPSVMSRSSGEIKVFEPTIDIDTATLNGITLIGDNIYYAYNINNYSEPTPKQNAVEPTESETTVNSEPNYIADENQSLVDSGNFDLTIDNDKILNTISVGWNVMGNGVVGLSKFVENNTGVVTAVQGYSDIYSSDILNEKEDVIGKMLYWVYNDCFFQASVPMDNCEAILNMISTSEDFIKEIN